jgi:hypothetical protein
MVLAMLVIPSIGAVKAEKLNVPVVIISTSFSYKILQTVSDLFSARLLQRYGTVMFLLPSTLGNAFILSPVA